MSISLNTEDNFVEESIREGSKLLSSNVTWMLISVKMQILSKPVYSAALGLVPLPISFSLVMRRGRLCDDDDDYSHKNKI